jgi:hypothetical protein
MFLDPNILSVQPSIATSLHLFGLVFEVNCTVTCSRQGFTAPDLLTKLGWGQVGYRGDG